MRPDFIDDLVAGHRKMIRDRIDAARRKRKDPRPKYISHSGLDIVDFRKKFRRRRTRAVFSPSGIEFDKNGTIIPGLKMPYFQIMGASPGTWYMRADGTAASVGDATGPGDTIGACMDVGTHNNDDLNEIVAGDVIKNCDDGGIFRATIIPPTAGTNDITRVTYESEDGDSPQAYGSTKVETWELDSGSKWKASLGTEPYQVWFINTDGTIYWGNEVADTGSLAAEYDWVWVSNELWCFTTPSGDPDSRYTSVEASARQRCFQPSDKDYITLDGLEVAFTSHSSGDGSGIGFWNCDYPIIQYVIAHHNGKQIAGDPTGNGIDVRNADGALVQYNTSYENGRRGIVFFAQTSETMDDAISQYNVLYDNYHSNHDVFGLSDGVSMAGLILRGNHSYLTSDYGTYGPEEDVTGTLIGGPPGAGAWQITGLKIYYNLYRDVGNEDGAIVLDRGVDGAEIYNNTLVDYFPGSTYEPGIDIRTLYISDITIKNNIGVNHNSQGNLRVGNLADITACDYNCWYSSSGNYVHVVGGASTPYTQGEWSSYRSETEFDEHGIDWTDSNPDFIDQANHKFKLKTESPCIGAGTSVGLEGQNDYEGKLIRPGDPIDMGCIQTLKGGPRRL